MKERRRLNDRSGHQRALRPPADTFPFTRHTLNQRRTPRDAVITAGFRPTPGAPPYRGVCPERLATKVFPPPTAPTR